MSKLLIIAGETSGDLHASGVVRELLKQNPKMEIFGIGGDLMKKEGMELIYHCNDLSVMGFKEIITQLPKILVIENKIKSILKNRKPEKILLIDFPGFNLRIAKYARNLGIKVFYYISPQIWAWKERRINLIKRIVDKMFVVFPFEKKFYNQHNMDVEFVGHPLLEEIKINFTKVDFKKRNNLNGKKIIGLIPGSRMQEIEKIFPKMIKAVKKIKATEDVDVIVPIAPNRNINDYKQFVNKYFDIKFVSNQTYEVMKYSDVALVTSGTATLETSLLGTPFAVLYKTSFLTYLIGKVFIKIKNIGLVNIVSEKEIVPEFVQYNLTTDNLIKFIKSILNDIDKKKMIVNELKNLKTLLGQKGASRKVAKGILNYN